VELFPFSVEREYIATDGDQYTRSKESQVSTNSPTLNIRIIEDKLSKSPR